MRIFINLKYNSFIYSISVCLFLISDISDIYKTNFVISPVRGYVRYIVVAAH